ncbi:MAG: hypothetical protein F4X36_16225 [Gammaproteobacteria bacterium]|nr:hypothetical protein [Gammaproteobacteria bacterium]
MGVEPDAHCSRIGRGHCRCVAGALALLVAVQTALGTPGDPGERARDHLARAIGFIQAERYTLARSYLDPVLVSPWITARQRARAYYYRGFAFASEQMYVSAAQDYVRALEFHPSLPQALSGLAHLYGEGLGLVRDDAAAFRLALKAARGGDGAARVRVGVSYLGSDIARARYWLAAAAEDGYAPAYVHLARSFRRAFTDAPDPEAARHWYERAEDAGSAAATLALGHMFRDGEFGTPDPSEAARRFERAAAAGSGHAQAALAHLYVLGAGLPRDPHRALALYTQAAARQVAAAYTGLGHLYETGAGTARDEVLAERWYRQGAEADDAVAQYRLGRMLLTEPAEDRLDEAVHWLQRAAGAGHAAAQNAAAWILATSRRDAVRNGPLALHLAERAVEQAEDADTLDTLAAALAEEGDFARAIASQRLALERIDVDDRRRGELLARLASYEAGRAWRE